MSQMLSLRHVSILHCPQALQKWEDSAINESLIIETQLKDMVKSFNADKPFTFVVSVDVSPQPTWKQPYRDIEVTPTPCMPCWLHALEWWRPICNASFLTDLRS